MSPPRRRGGDGPGHAGEPADIEALRTSMEAIARKAARKAQRKKAARTATEPANDEAAVVERDEPADGPWWEQEEAGSPIPVVGGIAARTKRGPIGSTWWSRRFLGALEPVMVGGRMDRGRSYARKGQVVELFVRPGVVEATVQGSREDPYRVRLTMPVVPDEDWVRILGALAEQSGYAARMLAGDLPREIEDVFESEGASLLPAPHARLATECTCPDWENPCKHVAAVCYLVAEELDRDPFAILAWRGRDREAILVELRALRSSMTRGPSDERSGVGDTEVRPPLEEPAGDFWAAGTNLAGVRVHPEASPVPAAVLRLAARGVITVDGRDVSDLLAPAYAEIAAGALRRSQR